MNYSATTASVKNVNWECHRNNYQHSSLSLIDQKSKNHRSIAGYFFFRLRRSLHKVIYMYTRWSFSLLVTGIGIGICGTRASGYNRAMVLRRATHGCPSTKYGTKLHDVLLQNPSWTDSRLPRVNFRNVNFLSDLSSCASSSFYSFFLPKRNRN